jgi:hypothetical protein
METTYYDDSTIGNALNYRVYWTARAQLDEHGDIEFLDIPRGIEFEDELLAEKLALLKMLDVGGHITEVGKRQSKNVYYIRFFEDECMGTGE